MLHNGTEFAGKKTKSCVMKKIICILFAMLLGMSIKASDDRSRVLDVCAGTSYNTVYTIRGNDICAGTSYNIVFTIRGNDICAGTSYNTVYTIRGNDICAGTSYDTVFTIR